MKQTQPRKGARAVKAWAVCRNGKLMIGSIYHLKTDANKETRLWLIHRDGDARVVPVLITPIVPARKKGGKS